ncbi:MAG: metallophosphoesterase, partial [Planctomycetes bacterium]|nr:metallophosphoesterase [Planctomycetota bacterium]
MNNPIYVISDLHIGAGGPRDSFSQYNRGANFNSFLDHVKKEGAELIILGDFLDLWRFDLKKIIEKRNGLLDRLAEMKISFILGNHDQALQNF